MGQTRGTVALIRPDRASTTARPRSRWRPVLADGPFAHGHVDLSRQPAAIGGTAEQPAPLGDDPAAQDRRGRPARHPPAFPRAVVADVEVLPRESLVHRGIDEDEVGVTAGGDGAL